jgi:transcriptional regulator with XRE-family HTH domain
LTKFGRYLKQKNLTSAEVAKALDLTRSYISMLKTGAATPGLHTAYAISKWSRGEVSFESWL